MRCAGAGPAAHHPNSWPTWHPHTYLESPLYPVAPAAGGRQEERGQQVSPTPLVLTARPPLWALLPTGAYTPGPSLQLPSPLHPCLFSAPASLADLSRALPGKPPGPAPSPLAGAWLGRHQTHGHWSLPAAPGGWDGGPEAEIRSPGPEPAPSQPDLEVVKAAAELSST